jgi:glycosyltransferase involved in cell wall biosynthesis
VRLSSACLVEVVAKASWYAVHGPNGDLSWRVTGPAEAIGAKLQLIPEEFGTDLFWPNSGSHFPWHMQVTDEAGASELITSKEAWLGIANERRRLTDQRAIYPAHEGRSAVFTRPLSWLAVHMLQLRKQGIRVVTEVDDYYLSPNRLSVMMSTDKTSEDSKDAHARSTCSGDAIIFSTEKLRDLYHKGFRKHFGKDAKYVPEFFVCRNHVDEKYIPTPIKSDGPIRVGYMGSDSHVWDVELIYPALAAAKQMGCEIYFIGIDPKSLNPKWQTMKWNWAALDYKHIPWTLDFRGTALPLDIGLAPLLVNEHTLGKSDIKAIEYALSDAACVAQNCEVYSRTLKHGEHVLLAGSPTQFITHTIQLIEDENLRRRLVDNTRQYINEERLLSKNKREWEEAVFG